MPLRSPIERYLQTLHERFLPLRDGNVATYIPELARSNPDWFGICVTTADGHVYEVGDTRQPFTIQSISKPLVYGLALEDRGKAAVLQRVGVEPTGDAFNEISLESGTGRPRNPMINAGAITATSLVAGDSPEDRWARILALLSTYAGRQLKINEQVYRSERDTGHRNRAISHMLRNFEIIERDPEPDLDLYFRQCSIETHCRDLSIMAATLATGGVNPITRDSILRASNVDEVLSVMTTCGMYDYAGEWVYRVGLPAKSGVAGGILAVLPGQLGIGVFSPPLDERGNSVRGVAACRALSDDLELHFLRAPRTSISAIRSRSTPRTHRSKRARTGAERELLDQWGDEAVVYLMQGDLPFSGMEVLIRRVVADPASASWFVFDFSRATDVDEPAQRMLIELYESLAAQDRRVSFVGLARHTRLKRGLEEAVATVSGRELTQFDELDLAIEWCEDALIEAHGASRTEAEEMALEKHPVMGGLDAAECELLAGLMKRRSYRPRQFVVQQGDTADEIFFVVFGSLSVLSARNDGRLYRLSTLSPGMIFGEQASVSNAARSAFVRADRPSVCWTLERHLFESLDVTHPQLKIRLLENLLRSATGNLNRLTVDVVAEIL